MPASSYDWYSEPSSDTAVLVCAGVAVAGVFAWLFWPATPPAARTAAGPGTGPQINFNNARFHFRNDFEDSTYLGISFPGLCGGMSFAALDYWHANRSPTQQTTAPSTDDGDIGEYIHSRQEDSLGENGAEFIALLADPADIDSDFSQVQAAINYGTPVPIGLIPYPWTLDATNAHQVVATGFDAGNNIIFIWDPNYPNAATQIQLQDGIWQESGGGSHDQWRGFFVETYTPSAPP